MEKKELEKLFANLFPLNRSILGKGYRESLKILKKYIPFKEYKYRSGEKVFDWTVPKEWKIEKAQVKLQGKKIIDYKKNNLHIVNYSQSVSKNLSLKELNKNLYSLKDQPNFIPYVTSYYKKNWGFCITHKNRKKLKNGTYNCTIKSEHINGFLINGLASLKGNFKKINLLSTYLCHPSMANNELSGPLVLVGLYKKIKNWSNRNYSYSFLVNPETIGSLCFLKTFHKKLKKNLNSGLVLTCLGGPKKKLSYKLSKNNYSSLDKLFKYLALKKECLIRPFDATTGSDERQYNSPGFNMKVGNICRTVYGDYPEYHTSGDNKKFMRIQKVKDAIDKLEKILKIHDQILPFKRTMPYGELMLGKHNLYPNINFQKKNKKFSSITKIILNILNYADGKTTILDIASKFNYNLADCLEAQQICINKKFIKFYDNANNG